MASHVLVLALACSMLASLHVAAFDIDPKFDGWWSGLANYSVVGPIAMSGRLQIQPTGGFLLEHAMTSGPTQKLRESYQQFWANNNHLYYCGLLKQYFPFSPAPIARTFEYQQSLSSERKLTFCSPIYAGGCNTIQYTLELLDDNTLEQIILLPKPIVHAHVLFVRAASGSPFNPADVNQCLEIFSRNTCQPLYEWVNTTIPAAPHAPPPSATRVHATTRTPVAEREPPRAFDHCIWLDRNLTLQLQWSADTSAGTLHAVLSSPQAQGWVALGFGQQFPYMYGADVALAYATARGPCVRALFAEAKVGFPSGTTTMRITNATVTALTKGLSFEFVRGLTDGKGGPLTTWNTVMYAMSTAALPADATCADEPPYHGWARGTGYVNFATGETPMDAC